MTLPFVCEQLKEDEPRLIHGAFCGMGLLMEYGCLLTKTYSKRGANSKGGAYWKEGAKSNRCGYPRMKT